MNIGFYIDPLTGMSNLYSLLESNINEICADRGTVIAFDLANIQIANQKYGRYKGDIYLKGLKEAIFDVFGKYDLNHFENTTFHIGGDIFIIIHNDIAALCSAIVLNKEI